MENLNDFTVDLTIKIISSRNDYEQLELEILDTIYDYIEKEAIKMDEMLEKKNYDFDKLTDDEKRRFEEINEALEVMYKHREKMEKILKYYKKRRGKNKKNQEKKNEVISDEETLKNLKEIYKK
jgi:siroheme synthase (precorrin-2 oxidase/ferrochelatase)